MFSLLWASALCVLFKGTLLTLRAQIYFSMYSGSFMVLNLLFCLCPSQINFYIWNEIKIKVYLSSLKALCVFFLSNLLYSWLSWSTFHMQPYPLNIVVSLSRTGAGFSYLFVSSWFIFM